MYTALSAQCSAHTQGQIYVAIIAVVEVGGGQWC